MSPLWPNQLLISLSNTHFAVLYRSGFAKRVLQQHAVSIAQGGWQAALTQLQANIAKWQVPAGTQLNISLASDIVRYMALPAQQVVMRSADKLAYARAAYLEMYGNVASDWHISCDDAPPNQPIIAAAIDASLYQACLQWAAQQHLKLATLQPYVASVFNRCSQRISHPNAQLAIVEQQRIVLIQLNQGVCQHMRSHKVAEDWQHTLQEVLTRARMLDAQVSPDVFVYAPLHQGALITSAQGWSLKKIALANPPKSSTSPFSTPLAMLEALV